MSEHKKPAQPLDSVHPKPLAMQLPPAPATAPLVERRDLIRRAALKGRVIAEFAEMPGLRLTFWQATRLFGVSEAVCDRVLGQLVAEGILCRSVSGAYTRRESWR